MIKKTFQCQQVDFSEYGQEMGVLRRKAWESVDEFDDEAFPDEVWVDDFDTDAIHYAVFDENKIIASARIGVYHSFEDIPYMDMMKKYKSLFELPVASFNRLVVGINFRRNGIAEILDKVRIDLAREYGVKTIVGQSVPCRIKSLRKSGFEYIDDIGSYDVLPYVELSLMIKKI